IRKLAPLAASARARGIKIFNLNIGQPDVATPPEFLRAVCAFKDKVLEYGPSDGLPELREGMAAYFARYEIALDPGEILITNGGSEAILFAFNVVADQGDEIIIPEPFYTNYNGFAVTSGVRLVPITTFPEDGYRCPSVEQFEERVTPRTRAIIVNSPGNQTGAVYTRREMERVASLAEKHNLYIISDEVYREFTFDGVSATGILDVEGMDERAIVIDSISKRYSACGARVGSVISRNNRLMEAVLRYAQARLCPPALGQVVAAAAYSDETDYIEESRLEYQRRRDVVFNRIQEIEGVVCEKPQGAFYALVKIPVDDVESFAQWLLTDFSVDGFTVMVAPGPGFYATPGLGGQEIRIAYVLNCEELEHAMDVLVAGIGAYNQRGALDPSSAITSPD
ncbi:MAG: pyridoxal phosphate-dependent aminotransferase, partial [bacterium]|nr:pyridoxal phosphate-dependent aminotransferase [bacterium]